MGHRHRQIGNHRTLTLAAGRTGDHHRLITLFDRDEFNIGPQRAVRFSQCRLGIEIRYQLRHSLQGSLVFDIDSPSLHRSRHALGADKGDNPDDLGSGVILNIFDGPNRGVKGLSNHGENYPEDQSQNHPHHRPFQRIVGIVGGLRIDRRLHQLHRINLVGLADPGPLQFLFECPDDLLQEQDLALATSQFQTEGRQVLIVNM